VSSRLRRDDLIVSRYPNKHRSLDERTRLAARDASAIRALVPGKVSYPRDESISEGRGQRLYIASPQWLPSARR